VTVDDVDLENLSGNYLMDHCQHMMERHAKGFQ
jgi:hypothetical protein